MATAALSLSINQLQAVFGVSHVTIHAWKNDTGDFPEVGKRTPAALKKWAKRHGKDLAKDPEVVASKPLKRLASGRLTGARTPTRTGAKRASH